MSTSIVKNSLENLDEGYFLEKWCNISLESKTKSVVLKTGNS